MAQQEVPSLTGFKALSFDCYGTLIDWEMGMIQDMQPILSRLPSSHAWAKDPFAAVSRLNALSGDLEKAEPTLLYDTNLARCFRAVAAEVGLDADGADPELAAAAEAFGKAPGSWAAFPDTVEGLGRLKRRFKLIILSNVSEASIHRAVSGPMGPVNLFDAVYTAEAIGSYKPALANFRYLFDHARRDLGVHVEDASPGQGELLHVAVSLPYDHVPAKELGLRSVWIVRRNDRSEGSEYDRLHKEGKLGFEWAFGSIGEFADEVDRQFAELEGTKGQ